MHFFLEIFYHFQMQQMAFGMNLITVFDFVEIEWCGRKSISSKRLLRFYRGALEQTGLGLHIENRNLCNKISPHRSFAI